MNDKPVEHTGMIPDDESQMQIDQVRYEEASSEPQFPPMMDMAKGLYHSMADWAQSGFQTAQAKEVERRLDICGKCNKFVDGRCTICGCFMNLKAKLATGSCPEGKW